MEARIYCQTDPEYRGNGHYFIEGEEWMTMWAYKESIGMPHTEQSNASDTMTLHSNFEYSLQCIPNYGIGLRYMFPVALLKREFDRARTSEN